MASWCLKVPLTKQWIISALIALLFFMVVLKLLRHWTEATTTEATTTEAITTEANTTRSPSIYEASVDQCDHKEIENLHFLEDTTTRLGRTSTNSIFFIESSTATDIKARVACAIESAAKVSLKRQYLRSCYSDLKSTKYL